MVSSSPSPLREGTIFRVDINEISVVRPVLKTRYIKNKDYIKKVSVRDAALSRGMSPSQP